MYICIMSEEFIYSSNPDTWNHNKTITKSAVDPFNANKKLTNLGFNLYKYNCRIFFDVI